MIPLYRSPTIKNIHLADIDQVPLRQRNTVEVIKYRSFRVEA